MPGAKVLDDSTITLSDVIASDNRRHHPGSQRQLQIVNQRRQVRTVYKTGLDQPVSPPSAS